MKLVVALRRRAKGSGKQVDSNWICCMLKTAGACINEAAYSSECVVCHRNSQVTVAFPLMRVSVLF